MRCADRCRVRTRNSFPTRGWTALPLRVLRRESLGCGRHSTAATRLSGKRSPLFSSRPAPAGPPRGGRGRGSKPEVEEDRDHTPGAVLWFVPSDDPHKLTTHFVDMQRDATVADIAHAISA